MSPPNWPSLGRPPKLLIPFMAAVGGVGALTLIVLGQQQIKQLQQQLMVTKQHAAQLEVDNQELTQRLGNLEVERKDLDKRLTSLRDQLTNATAELERSRTSFKEFEERYERVNEEREKLQTQVATLTSEREEATKRLKELEQENAEMKRSASRLHERFALLDRDYQAISDRLAEFEAARRASVSGPVMSSGTPPATPLPAPAWGGPTPATLAPGGVVELPPIVVRKDQAGMSIPVRGRVVEVNEPHHFIVVDKGSQDGVQLGMVFNILRGSASVGRATVIRVRPQLSACDIIRSSTTGQVQVGDLTVQNGS